ncbi:MAG TPA: hypothetical protein VLC93_04880 [Myxococcota bacterium]|nr:hypothetical protein [Myxococcota bacterium]
MLRRPLRIAILSLSVAAGRLAAAQGTSGSTGAGLVLPDQPPETPETPAVEQGPMPQEPAEPAPAPTPVVEPPPTSVEQLPALPVKPPPPRSTIDMVLPTHGCLDSGDTTVQLLSVLYENFASHPGSVNVTSAGFPALRRGPIYVFPERDSTQVMDARRFVADPLVYEREVLAERLPVLVNVQEVAFQYPYDSLFDTLAGIEEALAPGERFPLTTRRYGRLTRYRGSDTSILVLELETNERAKLSNEVIDYVPEFAGITQVTTADFKTTFYSLGRRLGRISRVWAETEPDRTRVKNPAMLVSMGDVLGTRMAPEILEHCGTTAKNLGYTAMVPVASELGLGPDHLYALANKFGLPYLASNLFRRETTVNDFTARPFPRFILQERDGLTIAFIGVVDPAELDTLPTSVRKTWRFEDMSIAIGRVVDELRTYLHRRPDLTVVLAASRDPAPLTRIEGVDLVIGPPVNSNIDPLRRVTDVPESPSELEVTYGSGALVTLQPPWRAVTRISTDLVRHKGRRRARPVRIVEERQPVLEDGPADPEIERTFRVAEERSLIKDAAILVPEARLMVEGKPELASLVWGDHILHRRGYRRAPRSQPARYSDPLWMRMVTNIINRETRSDIAISYNVPREWDIVGPISRETVGSWLRTGDSVQVVTLTGLELQPVVQRLARQLKAEDWPASQVLFVSGLDPLTGLVRGRALDPREPYRVAVSESVLTGRELADVFANKQADTGRTLLRSMVLDAFEREKQGPSGAIDYVEAMLEDESTKMVPRWKLMVNQLSLSASSYSNSDNIRRFKDTRESRVTQSANTQYGIRANVAAVYDSAPFAWETRLRLDYAKLIARNDTNDNGVPDQRISQETLDDVVLSSELRLNALQFGTIGDVLRVVPFVQAAYDTEFTRATENDQRQKLGRGIVGLVFFPGPRIREVRAGLLVQEDFSQPSPYDLNWGVAAGYTVVVPLYQQLRLESTLDLRYLFPDQNDLPSDIGFYALDVTRVLWPFWQQKLSFFVSADIVVVRGKSDDVLLADGTTISNRQFGGSWILSVGLDFSGVFTHRF